jgi:hypothetical protein
LLGMSLDGISAPVGITDDAIDARDIGHGSRIPARGFLEPEPILESRMESLIARTFPIV